ncbi:MAG: response regulator transcription factor [Chloroflexi bacterium]|nr:response regulator transcription factor [Chloroflexota bacterium]
MLAYPLSVEPKPNRDSQARVLVVDDEESIAELVATALRYEGFEVRTAGTGADAVATAGSFQPHVVVLDVMLPDVDGFEVLRQLRADQVDASVLFLTARDGTPDRVRGLTIGADDYITKPFSLAELVARVRVALRRIRPAAASRVLAFEDLELDEDGCEVRRGGVSVELTPTEYKLLRYLMNNPRRVLSKAQILDHVWDYEFEGDQNVVETYVSYLRKKLDNMGPPLIQTVRGFGYALRPRA